VLEKSFRIRTPLMFYQAVIVRTIPGGSFNLSDSNPELDFSPTISHIATKFRQVYYFSKNFGKKINL
jgi:hypothetical protein